MCINALWCFYCYIVIKINPFESKERRRYEAFNAVCVMFCIQIYLGFTDMVSSGETRYMAGSFLIFVEIVCIFSDLAILTWQTARMFMLRIERNERLKAYKKQK